MGLGEVVISTMNVLEKTIIELAELATASGAVLPPHLVDMVQRATESQRFSSRIEAGEDPADLMLEALDWSFRQKEKRTEAN